LLLGLELGEDVDFPTPAFEGLCDLVKLWRIGEQRPSDLDGRGGFRGPWRGVLRHESGLNDLGGSGNWRNECLEDGGDVSAWFE